MDKLTRTMSVLLLGLLLAGFPRISQAQLVLYDDFSSLIIDPEKWSGNEVATSTSVVNTDIWREINPDCCGPYFTWA